MSDTPRPVSSSSPLYPCNSNFEYRTRYWRYAYIIATLVIGFALSLYKESDGLTAGNRLAESGNEPKPTICTDI